MIIFKEKSTQVLNELKKFVPWKQGLRPFIYKKKYTEIFVSDGTICKTWLKNDWIDKSPEDYILFKTPYYPGSATPCLKTKFPRFKWIGKLVFIGNSNYCPEFVAIHKDDCFENAETGNITLIDQKHIKRVKNIRACVSRLTYYEVQINKPMSKEEWETCGLFCPSEFSDFGLSETSKELGVYFKDINSSKSAAEAGIIPLSYFGYNKGLNSVSLASFKILSNPKIDWLKGFLPLTVFEFSKEVTTKQAVIPFAFVKYFIFELQHTFVCKTGVIVNKNSLWSIKTTEIAKPFIVDNVIFASNFADLINVSNLKAYDLRLISQYSANINGKDEGLGWIFKDTALISKSDVRKELSLKRQKLLKKYKILPKNWNRYDDLTIKEWAAFQRKIDNLLFLDSRIILQQLTVNFNLTIALKLTSWLCNNYSKGFDKIQNRHLLPNDIFDKLWENVDIFNYIMPGLQKLISNILINQKATGTLIAASL